MYNIQTTLNTPVLANSSQEFIGETMFHELLHAVMDASPTVISSMEQHCNMISNYVGIELGSMQTMFPGLSNHDGLSIILGGMSDIQQYDPATLSAVLASFNLTLNDVVATNNAYKNGTKGTKCPPAQ